jgi:hypothetical protein
MLTEGAHKAELMKWMEYVGSAEDKLIRIVTSHQHDTYSTLL